MAFDVEKGYGLMLANFLRQSLLTKIETWRPIAFTLGSETNVVSAGDNIMEDSVEIGNNICSYLYDIDKQEDFFKFTATVRDLMCSDMMQGSINILNPDDKVIFHALNQDATVTIYFSKAMGSVSSSDNRALLQRHGINPDSIVIMNSRHTNLSSVTTDVVNKDEHCETIKIGIHAEYAVNEEELIRECCKNMISTLEKFI